MNYKKKTKMAMRRYAKRKARTTSRKVFRGTRKKSKMSLRRILANFAGRSSYKKARSIKRRPKRRRIMRRKRY